MHPAIAQLPADLFYGGKISSGVSAEQRPPAPGFQWPQPSWPVALLPVYTGGEASDGLSKVNRAEVDAVAAVVHGLCAAGLSAADIGVVSPYAAQVLYLPDISPSSPLYLPFSPLSPRYLPFISTTSPLHLPYAAQVLYLPYISPSSPRYLPYISPSSPLHLPYISPSSPLRGAGAPAAP